ncbi:MAG: ABC transporter permease [Clostridium sp.]|nr:ABC transporter permease [Clostridium sp.]
MDRKFIFFDIKRNFIANLLIIIEVALWIFYTASLVSLINFDNSYKKRYRRSIPIENAEVMKFYKMGISGDYEESRDDCNNKIKESLKLIKDNGYNYGFIQRNIAQEFPSEIFGINENDLKGNFTKMEKNLPKVSSIGFNYGMIENYKNNINGEVFNEEWVIKDNLIPVIVGCDIAEKVKVGESYIKDEITYKIIGTFKKDTLAFDYTNTVDSSFLLNKSFVIPLSEDKFFENFNYEPITIFFKGDKAEVSSNLNKGIEKVSSDIVVEDFENDLDKFLYELRTKKYYEICRIFIVTIIALTSIITTISYKIVSDRDRIGILYSFGTSKKDIFKIFATEFSVNILIGIFGGSLFYIKNCASVYSFFINENLLFNLYISIGILFVVIFLITLTGLSKINKLTPREMIGGFVE